MLLSASLHACIYMLTFAPKGGRVEMPAPELKNGNKHSSPSTGFTNNHLGTWDWGSTVEVSQPSESPDLRTSTYLILGVLGYATAVMLGLASLPSIASSLSWREFRLLQSKLGWCCLLLSSGHAALNGWKKLVELGDCGLPAGEQLALVLPVITMVAKLPLLLPSVDSRLTAIRQCRVF